MKKVVIFFLMIFSALSLWGENNRAITFEQLPGQAREFITSCFPDTQISYIKMESDLWEKEYQVVFVTGCKVEFDRQGRWKEVDCKYAAVPLMAVPGKIRDFVESKHAGQFITELERTKRGYDAKLSDGIEIGFDMNFNFLKYD